ncbi:MAG: M3 family oligoendopeptidase [Chloroflexi bacterium]|nr:M3 family oligoendopeptidase [Chloroflexota bacterium]MCI0576286.1 M3 family oligoendopeptidase [Chloroflexota bacterium]MCI0644518.1 M3 family oligoendopeptidase [Chloroflexota bacterium]MCI0728793.1 M3 family oligoendopeptidase [Chloroflexota bacterium]
MTLPPLPGNVAELDSSRWETFEPYYQELQTRELAPANARQWLEDWSRLSKVVREVNASLYIEKTLDTTDEARERAFLDFINHVEPQVQIAEQALKERLLALDAAGAAPSLGEDVALVLRNMRNEADLFRKENVPLLTELERLSNEYDKMTGSMAAQWDGESVNLSQLNQFLYSKDRAVRERAWKTMMDLWAAQRQELNKLYSRMLRVRQQVASNAGLPDYRAYSFRESGRFDYTPEDCLAFHRAIERVVVPAAARILEKRRHRLGLERLRPWDVGVEPGDQPPLKPYESQAELIGRSRQMFQQVDPELGRFFATMDEDQLLDLSTRPGKALGGYCQNLPLRQRPFIFMNGVGLHEDVQTLLHEAGHAFHDFEASALPLVWHLDVPLEFCEVASMSMELLAAPYLIQEYGGFYTSAEAARARIEHLEGIILFLPYMAVVDAFQHWVYTHPQEAADAARCDATWDTLWARFMPVINWEGFEAERMSGWHRKPHIFQAPFYYVEYGLAQVGALQVWRNSLHDQAGAVATYRRALARGGTQTLPELFATAGAKFRFDEAMLSDLVALVEETVTALEKYVFNIQSARGNVRRNE